jgi:hypothetical protein
MPKPLLLLLLLLLLLMELLTLRHTRVDAASMSLTRLNMPLTLDTASWGRGGYLAT